MTGEGYRKPLTELRDDREDAETVVGVIDREIATLNDAERRDGTTQWVLMAATGAAVWTAIGLVPTEADGTVTRNLVGATLASFLGYQALSATTSLFSGVLHDGSPLLPAGARLSAILSAVLNAGCVAATLWLYDQNAIPGCLVATIVLSCALAIAGAVFVAILSLLHDPIQVSRRFSRDVVAMLLVFGLAAARGIGGVWMASSLNDLTVGEWRFGLLAATAGFLFSRLASSAGAIPLRRSLIALRREVDLGEATPDAARLRLRRLLRGVRLDGRMTRAFGVEIEKLLGESDAHGVEEELAQVEAQLEHAHDLSREELIALVGRIDSIAEQVKRWPKHPIALLGWRRFSARVVRTAFTLPPADSEGPAGTSDVSARLQVQLGRPRDAFDRLSACMKLVGEVIDRRAPKPETRQPGQSPPSARTGEGS